MIQGDQEVHFTYGEVHKYAGRIGSFLLKSGVRPGDRVLLISENRPEWGIAYFGILRSGATAVPVDPELSEAEVINLASTSQAVCCLISEQAARTLPGLFRALGEANPPRYIPWRKRWKETARLREESVRSERVPPPMLLPR
jgi:long-chain acyl-CoA synthetase